MGAHRLEGLPGEAVKHCTAELRSAETGECFRTRGGAVLAGEGRGERCRESSRWGREERWHAQDQHAYPPGKPSATHLPTYKGGPFMFKVPDLIYPPPC